MRWWIYSACLLAMAGCTDSAKSGGTRPPITLVNPEPEPMPAPEPVMDPDRGEPDVGAIDATLRDAVIDATIDAGAVDFGVTDAADMAVDAQPPFVWPPEDCEGVVIPPMPASPDGSEVCNYEDDDGDGFVDEGHGYVRLGSTVVVPQELIGISTGQFRMIGTNAGYVISWSDHLGVHILVADAAGCVRAPDQVLSMNPNGGLTLGPGKPLLAYNGGRVAILYSQQRPLPDGRDGPFGTWLQLMTPQGELLGPSIDLIPGKFGQTTNAIIPFEDDKFAVFTTTANPVERGFMYGELIIVDRDGREVGERVTPFDGQRAVGGNLNGMAYGDGHFALAWQGGWGIIAIFNRAGEMRALRAIQERMYARAVAWTGQYFATTLINASGVLPLFDLDGQQPEWSPVNPTDDPEPRVGELIEQARGFVAVHSLYEPRNVRRLDLIWRMNEVGEPIAPPTPSTNQHAGLSLAPSRPLVDFRAELDIPGLQLVFSGCERGEF